jgi:hypothetical protein
VCVVVCATGLFRVLFYFPSQFGRTDARVLGVVTTSRLFADSHLRDRFHNIRRCHNLFRIVKYLQFRRFGMRPSVCRVVPRYCFCDVRELENRPRTRTDWTAGPVPRKHLTCDRCSAWDWPRAGQVLASRPIRGRHSVARVTEILLASMPDSKP